MRLNYKIYSLFLAIAVMACDGHLDIEPDDIIVENDVYKSEVLADRALGESYLLFYRASVNSVGYTLGDFSTDITECSEFNDRFNSGDLAPIDDAVLSMWSNYYAAINSANNLIVKIPLLATYDEDIQDRQVAEAKFLRAYSYFSLLRYYGSGALTGNMNGLGLPLQLTPFEGYTTEELIPRSTNGQVYDQIFKDLNEAYEVLPLSYSSNLDTRTRATKGAVDALFSRIYLYLGDYEEAADHSKLVLDQAGVYSLSDNLLQLFPRNADANTVQPLTKEHIFAFPVSGNNMGSQDITYTYFYKRSVWVSDEFLESHEINDMRADTLIFEGYIPNPPSSEPELLTRKTTFKYNERTGRDNVVMIRLAEVMLSRAEALAQTTGVNQESVDLLNQVRNRAFKQNEKPDEFTISDFSNAAELIDRILLERKFELAFEGHHRFDLIRTGRDLKYPGLTDDQKVLPIPNFEVQISQGIIKQNPGY